MTRPRSILGEPRVVAVPLNPTGVPPRGPGPVQVDCVNCAETFTRRVRPPTPYCSPRCKDVAKAVRYGRAAVRRHGRPLPDDVEYALRVKVAWALSGGYPSARRLTPGTRTAVWERDDGRCMLCGQPGEEIDHVAGDSADLANLRLLCRPCHRRITDARLRPITDPDTREQALQITQRLAAPHPLLPCDDPQSWPRTWRTWLAEHSRHLL